MAAEVEEGDAVAVVRVLEDVEHLVHGGVGSLHDLAETGLHGRLQGLAHVALLFREIAEIAGAVGAVVGEGEEDDDRACRAHGCFPAWRRTPIGSVTVAQSISGAMSAGSPSRGAACSRNSKS